MDNNSKNKAMTRVTLTNKEGAEVSVWPVDVAGWKKVGYYPKGEPIPAAVGVDMLTMTKAELKELAETENLPVAFVSKDSVQDMVNKILVARETAGK